MNINLQLKFPPGTTNKQKEKVLLILNNFAESNKSEIEKIPETIREKFLYQIVLKILEAEGIKAQYRKYPKASPELSGIDLCEPF